MQLISYGFMIFVILLLIVYFAVPLKWQWVVLLVASMFFYICSDWKLAGYLGVTIVSQFFFAIKMDDLNNDLNCELLDVTDNEKRQILKQKCKNKKKKYLWYSVLVNLGMLCFVKYTNFIGENVNYIFDLMSGMHMDYDPLNILIPLGISFYTFQSTGYVIDVYRGKEQAERNFFKFALFVSFFPTIIQGPIERHCDLAKQLYEPHRLDYKRLCFGAQRMIWGYIKKIVIADRINILTTQVLDSYEINGYGSFIIFGTILLCGIRVYADFSGGMDIVIGLCEILGIRLTENFQRPYFATSISDYWKRWHITLGSWFKRYVFYSISLSKRFNGIVKAMKKRFGESAKYIPATLASLVVFWIIGIWHGANWKYIFYGLYSAFWVSTGTLFQDVYKRGKALFKIQEERLSWKAFQIIRTIFFVTIGRYFSFAQNATDAFRMLKITFTKFDPWVLFDGSFYKLGLNEKNFRLMLFSILIMFVADYLNEKGIIIREKVNEQGIIVRWSFYYAAIFFLIIFGIYGPGYNASDFVYMHF
jgi:D-alanyl-lipoteichoic acid acyltransferase DltB (MBOAT superfamily)